MPATVSEREVLRGNCPLCSPLSKDGGTLESCSFNVLGPIFKCTKCHCRFYPKRTLLGFRKVYELHIHQVDLDRYCVEELT